MSIKQKIKNNPKIKKLVLKMIFRPEPNSSKLRLWLWLIFILPKYCKRGIDWNSRLDLAPFNKFKFGKNARIERNAVINNGMGDMIFHDEARIGIGSILIGPIELQKNVTLAQYVRVLGMHHGLEVDTPHHYQPCYTAPVIVEEDAFIGTGTVIVGKKNGETLRIGKSSRIGANAVVMTDIPAYSVAVGNPAKVVRVWDFEKKQWVKPEHEDPVKVALEIHQVRNN